MQVVAGISSNQMRFLVAKKKIKGKETMRLLASWLSSYNFCMMLFRKYRGMVLITTQSKKCWMTKKYIFYFDGYVIALNLLQLVGEFASTLHNHARGIEEWIEDDHVST
jgi:nucleosome binding factor SPN SPT16 subunit